MNDEVISEKGAGTSLVEQDKRARDWAMFGHLSGLVGWSLIPLGNLIAPLVIWQLRKDELPFAGEEAKEALNFQISLSIYFVVAVLLCVVLVGFLLVPAIYIGGVVLTIIGGIRASNGERYRYPFTLRLVS